MARLSTWNSGPPSRVHELLSECRKWNVHFLQKRSTALIRFSMGSAPKGLRTAIVKEGRSASRSSQRGAWIFFFPLTFLVSPGGQISHLYGSSSIPQVEREAQNSTILAVLCGRKNRSNLGPRPNEAIYQQVTQPQCADFLIDKGRMVTFSHQRCYRRKR